MQTAMAEIEAHANSKLQEALRRWSSAWALPDLSREISIRTSKRFRTSLGRYSALDSEIALAHWLLEGPEQLLEEVLCHEAAHAAVHRRFGSGVRPHGAEWRELMRRAGFPARVRIPSDELPRDQHIRIKKAPTWEHRCPVCQVTRLARTRVTRWRCRACRDQGRSGELVIERLPDRVAVHP
jgi:predicted SprT family Zn-dependent metalloprotease